VVVECSERSAERIETTGDFDFKPYGSEMKKEQKVCLITGASSGIGHAIAKALKKDGHVLVLTARRKDRMQDLGGKGVDIVAGDLTSNEFLDNLDKYVYDKYDRCDILFNCAGIQENAGIEEMDVDRMSFMVRLNVESTFRLTYRFLKRFKAQGFGHIINISSILGTKVRPTAGAYAGTKFALEALSEALRMELAGTNIKISCIEPGLVMTELHKRWKVHPKISMGIHEPLVTGDIVEAVRYILRQPDHVRIPRLMILPKEHVI
jgi:NADP-dependent 3-hydroxy acid dehydrogenase YdfG